MTTLFAFHEVEDGERWEKAWREGAGSRHEMFSQIGAKCRTFRDPDNANLKGVLMKVPDMDKFHALLASDEGAQAMEEDGLKLDTLHILNEFTP